MSSDWETYLVEIDGGEPADILVRADLQALHVHTVHLSELDLLRLLHQKLQNDLVECFLESLAVRTPGNEELDHNKLAALVNELLEGVVIQCDGSDTVGGQQIDV